MHTLQDVGVVVTRPAAQAEALCHSLLERGARIWRFPALDIRPLDSPDALAARIESNAPVELVIFTSANAVRFGAVLLRAIPRLPRLAAIGPATRRALHGAGYPTDIAPEDSIDSEGLLAHERLQNLAGQTVLLVKGIGGRTLLSKELAARGARVVEAPVYERRPVHPSLGQTQELEHHISTGDIHVVTATSVEVAKHVLASAPAELRSAYDGVHWLVPGSRVAQELRALGCQAPLLIAQSAEDQELVAALERWRAAPSAA